jgi:hypothetical protein
MNDELLDALQISGVPGVPGVQPCNSGILAEHQAKLLGFQRFQNWLICSPVRRNLAKATRNKRQLRQFPRMSVPVFAFMTDGRRPIPGAS